MGPVTHAYPHLHDGCGHFPVSEVKTTRLRKEQPTWGTQPVSSKAGVRNAGPSSAQQALKQSSHRSHPKVGPVQLQPCQGHPSVSGGENEEQVVLDSWGPGLALPRCRRAGPPEHPLC